MRAAPAQCSTPELKTLGCTLIFVLLHCLVSCLLYLHRQRSEVHALRLPQLQLYHLYGLFTHALSAVNVSLDTRTDRCEQWWRFRHGRPAGTTSTQQAARSRRQVQPDHSRAPEAPEGKAKQGSRKQHVLIDISSPPMRERNRGLPGMLSDYNYLPDDVSS